jgi:hypothetical protein
MLTYLLPLTRHPTDPASVPSASARRSTSSSSRIRSKSMNSCASYTKRSRRKTTSCATTSSTCSRASSRLRAKSHPPPPASTSIALTASPRACLRTPSSNTSSSPSSSSNHSTTVPSTTATEVCQSDRSASFRWLPRRLLLPSTAPALRSTPTSLTRVTIQISVPRPMSKVSIPRRPPPIPTHMLIERQTARWWVGNEM